MKAIIALLLIGFTLSYDRKAALDYAKKYCRSYNSAYNNYKGKGGDCANFVSQCLKAGGLKINNCGGWLDSKGCLPAVDDLKACLQKKGWHHSTKKPDGFKAGHVLFSTTHSHAMLASYVSGNKIRVYGHTNDRCDEDVGNDFEYYYD